MAFGRKRRKMSSSPMEENQDVGNSAEEETYKLREKAQEHKEQLQRLQDKDPEFYQYLQEHDKELLDFDDEEFDEDHETSGEQGRSQLVEDIQKPGILVTTTMVESWAGKIKDGKVGSIRKLLQAFRVACHYGDDEVNDASKYRIASSGVFNKIMVVVLNEMDGILRQLLNAPLSGGKMETIMELMKTKAWKKNGNLMMSYLGNSLHILTQMTDAQMISFTLKRVKASSVFLAVFPVLLRKYIKVAIHTWHTGSGALPVVSFLFLRDLCVRVGIDCLDPCLKGVYKAYVSICKLSKSVSRSKLQHINFLANCVIELYGVDVSSAYQHAFNSVRQLAIILRSALTEKRPTKTIKDDKENKPKEVVKNVRPQGGKAYQRVYDWSYIFCLELWTGVICAYGSDDAFKPLAYPLTQIISGVASLVPTARYLPIRFRCVKMLNRISLVTSTYIPIPFHLLDVLNMKALSDRPVGGIGKDVNFLGVKQLDEATMETRGFQEACVFYVVEGLSEHFAQWSYSISFFELAHIPLVRLRSFCKATKADRLRREVKELIHKMEANCKFVNSKRSSITFLPNDLSVSTFLMAEKESNSSPLSSFAAELRQRAQQRIDSLSESSVVVGKESSVFGSRTGQVSEEDERDDTNGDSVFSSSWLPEKKRPKVSETMAKGKRPKHLESGSLVDRDELGDDSGSEDVIEDLILSSDDDEGDVVNENNGGEGGSDSEGEPKRNLNLRKEEPFGSKKAKTWKRKKRPRKKIKKDTCS